MAKPSKSHSVIAGRYAGALIDLAEGGKELDRVGQDLTELETMIAGSDDLKFLIRNPLIKGAQQAAVIAAIAKEAKFSALTANFLGAVVKNRRLSMLSEILTAVRDTLARRRGEVTANVQSAYALTPSQTKDIQAALKKALGTNVGLNVEINRDLIGGFVVTVGSTMIDDSVKRKLERLQQTMSQQSNQNLQTKEVG